MMWGENNDSLANLMHLHVNINFAAQLMMDHIDKHGKINLHQYLQSLMNDINLSIGNVNNFTINYDNDDNRIVIMDSSYPKYGTRVDPIAPAKFEAFGSKGGLGRSFLKDMRFNVEISKDHGSMMAISAQAGGKCLRRINNRFKPI